MDTYYPQHKEDKRFILLLTLLNPILITNTNVVNQLYEQINTYND